MRNAMSNENAVAVFQGYSNEIKKRLLQCSLMPTASADLLNKIVQFVGATDANYTNGLFYKCVLDDETYKWEAISSEGDKIFVGTQQQWADLSIAEKTEYDYAYITDDLGAEIEVVDAVTDGDMRPVSSNAVYDHVASKISGLYRPAGSKTCEELTSSLLIVANLGKVFNMSDAGTTTSDFVEGAGKPIRIGDNVGIVDIGTLEVPAYRFDHLSGIIDTSNFVEKEAGKGLSTNDYTDTDKNKVGKIDETTTSATGNPISISGLKSTQLAVEPVITFEPIQDLHGQSKPYPAGGGKNKIKCTVDSVKAENTTGTWTGNAYELKGITYTLQVDNANNVIGINVNGTANANSSLQVGKYDLGADAYILTGCPSGGSGSTYYLDWRRDDGKQMIDTGSGSAYTSAGQTGKVSIIVIVSGTSITNKVFYPMIRKSTDSSDFAPSSNYAPISGYDKIEVLSCGKNIFDINKVHIGANITAVSGTTISLTGGYNKDLFSGQVGLQSASAKKLYIKAGTYTVSWTTSLSGTPQIYLDLIDEETLKPIGGGNTVTSGGRATFSRNGWICIKCVDTGTYTISNLQIEEGTTASTYEPCNKTTDLSESLGQTVYGGTLDVRTGKFTVTHKIVDMGDLSWSYDIQYQRFLAGAPNIKEKGARELSFVCSCYECISDRRELSDVPNYVIYSSGSYLYIHDSGYTNATTFKTAVTGQKVAYPLATPTENRLTPHEISLLKDYAYVSTNGTSIALDYHNGELASLADVAQVGKTINALDRIQEKQVQVVITSYNSSTNMYSIPFDGYITAYLPSGTGYARVTVYDNKNQTMGMYQKYAKSDGDEYYAIFVKKGMRAMVTTNSGFTPVVTYCGMA